MRMVEGGILKYCLLWVVRLTALFEGVLRKRCKTLYTVKVR